MKEDQHLMSRSGRFRKWLSIMIAMLFIGISIGCAANVENGGEVGDEEELETVGEASPEDGATIEDTQADESIPDFTDPDSLLVLVNKEHHLPADYVPSDLVEPAVPFPFEEDLPKKLLREEAARALEALFEASEAEGLSLFAISGYRSYERQEAIFAYNASLHGEEEANLFSARAGESEHQTGLAMDVSSPAVKLQLVTEFADTEEGKWLAENASRFGFIIRYPEGKTEITQYQYEPWHLRYVGREAAEAIAGQNITLEEYIEGFHKP